MSRSHPVILILVTLAAACGTEDQADQASTLPDDVGSIESHLPAFDELVPVDAAIEILAEGHGWTEGPVWVAELGGLLYSDIPASSIYLYRDETGSEPWLEPTDDVPGGSGASNGLILDRSGNLLLAQHGDRRIARLESWDRSGVRFATLADAFGGNRLNSPNDMVVGPAGDIYFTDPPYGLAEGDSDPAKELATNGVYRLLPSGAIELVDDGLRRPNGIALAPDGRTLYVASSHEEEPFVVAYDVLEDGSVGARRSFADSGGDGMAVDQAGNVYVTEPMRGVFVFDPSGRHIGSILTGQRTSNVAWGDDGSTLYITADSYLMRIRLNAVGLGF